MSAHELLLLLQCLLLQQWTVEPFCEEINIPDKGYIDVGKLLGRHDEIDCRTYSYSMHLFSFHIHVVTQNDIVDHSIFCNRCSLHSSEIRSGVAYSY